MATYYNEIDPYCCAWLRNLMAAGLIPDGEVDSRSIADVQPDDLVGFDQCHFFAGIGGWPYALRLAGWPDNRPVWTGSCPCQPFSVAGARKGFSDERHLWPEWRRLIAVGHPPVVFGEQVAAASQWLAGVRSDLEVLGYAVGAVPIQAACAGAAQYRDRYWFVAHTSQHGVRPFGRESSSGYGSQESSGGFDLYAGDGSLASPYVERQGDGRLPRRGELRRAGGAEEDPHGVVADSDDSQRGSEEPERNISRGTEARRGESYGDAPECSARRVVRPPVLGWGQGWTESEFRSRGFTVAVTSSEDGSIQFIECPDGKWRRLPPPGVRWLGNGIPARVAKLRAFGNAIYPPLAAEFVRAYMETECPL